MKLKKELGLLEVFCISSGAMISSGLFVLPAIAYSKAGPYIVISYMIAGLLVIPTILSKSELVTAMPQTGGIYFFTDRSMGPAMGTLGGLAAWFSLAFKSAFALLGIGIFALFFGLSIVYVKIVAVACILLFMTINLLGVKLAGKVQSFLVLILLALLVLYVGMGVFSVDNTNFSPSEGEDPVSLGAIMATAGLVFVSYAGTTKITELAGEVKDPGKNLPKGMFLSWGVVTLLYIFVIFVTVGVLGDKVDEGLSPITDGGLKTMGYFGLVVMSFAAMLAYVSTGNAGILAASRDPMAMGKDELLPKVFGNVSKRGSPSVAIIFTSAFMILVVLFLDLEDFVKTASTLKLTLFVLANLSLIFMREANIRHYRPKFKAPLYPYVQIFGIIAYIFLIFQMGYLPLMIAGTFLLCGLGWYFIYAHGRIKREYALLHVVERVMGIRKTDYLLDEELREILVERDDLTESRFARKIQNCVVLDLEYFVAPEQFAERVSKELSGKLKMGQDDLYRRLMRREKDSNIIVRPGFAVISFHIKGRNRFEIALVRTKRGARFSDDLPPVRAAFIVVSSSDEQDFYLHSLMWLVQVAEGIDFERDWTKAKDEEQLRHVLLTSWKNRGIEMVDIKE